MVNGFITLDKPEGVTSHTAVNKVRRILNQKRVGHGGTLDPMATGVLPIFAGSATKAAQFVQESDKAYVTDIVFGVTTDTQDITGTVVESKNADVSAHALSEALNAFCGKTEQLPPMYSAISVGGTRLYKLARSGIEIDRPKRTIEVYGINVLEHTLNGAKLEISCSKGTYIRTLCADIGEYLGCGACISSLRRTKNGMFTLDNAFSIDELCARAEAGTLEDTFTGADELFPEIPKIYLSENEEKRIHSGAPVYGADFKAGEYRVYGSIHGFMGLGTVRETDRRPELTLSRGLWCE